MNAEAFRYLYDYHFAQNRKIWDEFVIRLTFEQFTQAVNYSHGSIRSQVVHLMNIENRWFSGLNGLEEPKPYEPPEGDDRAEIRARWDEVEQMQRAYLAGLTDDQLLSRPFASDGDETLVLWQALIHVTNHGTDHRAQILRALHDLGFETQGQDFIYFVYGRK